MEGDALGFNVGRINDLRTPINDTCQRVAGEISDTLHNRIVVPMASAWFAPEAQDFFNGFAEAVASCSSTIQEAFETFRGAIEEAGSNWADNTGDEHPVLAALDNVDLKLDVSDILAHNLSGSTIIDPAAARNVVSLLPQIQTDIESNLESLARNLEADTAFIGGNQAGAIEECFVKVSGAVHKIFSFLTEGDNNFASQVEKAIDKYGEVSQSISDSFNNAQIGE